MINKKKRVTWIRFFLFIICNIQYLIWYIFRVMCTSLLEVRNVKTHFMTIRGEVRAVDDISFKVNQGETLSLVGESGCGKSVTALSIIRLVAPPGRIVGGEIIFEGRDLLELNKNEMRAIRGDE